MQDYLSLYKRKNHKIKKIGDSYYLYERKEIYIGKITAEGVIKKADAGNKVVEIIVDNESDSENHDEIAVVAPFISHSFPSEENEKICHEICRVWNEVSEWSLNGITASYNRKNMLQIVNVHKNIFNSRIESWIDYARKVLTSSFLMGEKKLDKQFKATWNFLLKQETIDCVKSSQYGIGDRVSEYENLSIKKELLKSIIDYIDKSRVTKYITANEIKIACDIVNKRDSKEYDILRDTYGIYLNKYEVIKEFQDCKFTNDISFMILIDIYFNFLHKDEAKIRKNIISNIKNGIYDNINYSVKQLNTKLNDLKKSSNIIANQKKYSYYNIFKEFINIS
jgi:hypothetical protein